MDTDITQFVVSFLFGLLWYRIIFFIFPSYFKKPIIRSVLKLRWHHLHWGIMLMLSGTALLVASGKSALVIILLGIGLGLVIDLFIPSLQLQTDREKELFVYRNSLVSTLLLGSCIIVILNVLNFLL